MVLYSEKILSKEFSNEISKKAYLDTCKWLAINVYSKKDYSEIINVNIQKKQSKTPTFVVTLFVSIDENDFKNRFCSKCKQLHTLFYSIDNLRCEECKITAYRKKIKEEIKNLREYFENIFEEE